MLAHLFQRTCVFQWRIISGSMMCCGPRSKRTVTARQADTISPEETQMCQRDCAERAERYFRHPTDSQIALTSHAPLVAPGKIIHVVRTRPEKSRSVEVLKCAFTGRAHLLYIHEHMSRAVRAYGVHVCAILSLPIKYQLW